MTDDTLIGRQIDEYQIDKALGAGGMARVYRALDTKLQRYVALKVIAPNFRTDDDYTKRFEREAQSIARLDHPNIVHIYRFGEADGLYYMAMQYVEGADVGWLIEDYRKDGEVMAPADALRIVHDIGAALDYAHGKAVIHRDVKPGNIIVDPQGRAILTDFGLALLSDVGTHGEIFGSPSYIAPEQAISSGNVVPQSDLYALGVAVFEMLTGELPFSGDDPMEIAMKHVSDPPPAPSQFNKMIPPAVDAVVLRCLEKEPAARYQTGKEFSEALWRAATGWQPSSVQETARHPSMIVVPQKVDNRLQASPLPPVPPERPPLSPVLTPSLSTTMVAGPAGPTRPIPNPPTTSPTTPSVPAERPRRLWLYPVLAASVLFCVGLVCLVGLFLARGGNAQTVISAATATSTLLPDAPTVTAVPTSLPTLAPTLAPSLAPTFTAVLLPGNNGGGNTLPTAAPVVQLPPPADRSIVPANSVRLGEFTVEGYCTDRGFGVVLANNNADWACTNTSNNTLAFVLGPSDFDTICRTRYGRPNAFAIRDQQKDVQAYNWSCYDYTSAPSGAATPSPFTLTARMGPDWFALVSASDLPLDVSGVRFTRDDQVLTASNWGVSTLNRGECLRIYRSTPPAQPPQGCSRVFDYPGGDFWFGARVTVSINANARYVYPSP